MWRKCVHVCVYIFVCACVYVCPYMCVYICYYVYLCGSMNAGVFVYALLHVRMCVYMEESMHESCSHVYVCYVKQSPHCI